MKKLFTFLALLGAMSFLPLTSAQAGTRVVDPVPHRHVVVHRAPVVYVGRPLYRRPVLARRPLVCRRPVYRVCGPRRFCRPRHWGVGIGIRI